MYIKTRKFIYFLGSILFYGILALLEFLPETGWISTLTMNWGEGFILWNPLSFGGAIVLISLLLFINYIVQLHFFIKSCHIQKIPRSSISAAISFSTATEMLENICVWS